MGRSKRSGLRPNTALVHGKDEARLALKKLLEERFDAEVQLARPGMERQV